MRSENSDAIFTRKELGNARRSRGGGEGGVKKASETRQLVYTVTLRISRLSIVHRDDRAAF